MGCFPRDLRLAFRRLMGQPGTTALAVAALALGIGFTATMFSIVRGVLLRDLPFEEPERLVVVGNANRGYGSAGVSLHAFHDWRRHQSSFTELAAHQTFFNFVTGPLEDGAAISSETYVGAFTTANLFNLLGVRPWLGRSLEEADESSESPLAAVIGYQAWLGQFGADPEVIGKTIKIDRKIATIVGVMPEGFRFPYRHQLWLPLRLEPDKIDPARSPTLGGLGRLREGVSAEQARAELDLIATRNADDHPPPGASNVATAKQTAGQTVVEPYISALTDDDVESSLRLALVVVFAVLLIACGNVANLLLARATQRAREIAVRTALGAGRLRIASELLAESTVLAVIGGLGGLALAHTGVNVFNRSLGDSWLLGFWIDVRLDPVVLSFVGGLVILTSLVAGIVPALRTASADPSEVLGDAAHGVTSRRLGRFSQSLVIVQISLSSALLIGSGLMVRTLLHLGQGDHAINKEGVFTATISNWQGDYPDGASRLRFFAELKRRVANLPGAIGVGYSTALPFNYARGRDFPIKGHADEPVQARWIVTSPNFFEIFGIPLLEGRAFRSADRAGQLPTVIVNRAFAERHFPAESAIGHRIQLATWDGTETGAGDEVWAEIVGVVANATVINDSSADASADAVRADAVYGPLAQHPTHMLSLAVRTHGEPLALTSQVRREVNAIDYHAVCYEIASMEGILRRTIWNQRILGVLLAIFAVAAVALACIGLYSVMAFAVRLRSREMGLRMALGARPAEVRGLVLRWGLRRIAAGLVLGLAAAAYLSRFMGSLLAGVEPLDLGVYVLVTTTLTASGLLACWMPAARASRVDPMIALRQE